MLLWFYIDFGKPCGRFSTFFLFFFFLLPPPPPPMVVVGQLVFVFFLLIIFQDLVCTYVCFSICFLRTNSPDMRGECTDCPRRNTEDCVDMRSSCQQWKMWMLWKLELRWVYASLADRTYEIRFEINVRFLLFFLSYFILFLLLFLIPVGWIHFALMMLCWRGDGKEREIGEKMMPVTLRTNKRRKAG